MGVGGGGGGQKPYSRIVPTNVARIYVEWTNVTVTVGLLNWVGLVSVCAKFQLPGMSRSGPDQV